MNDNIKIDCIKQFRENPILAIETLIGRKLSLWEKIILIIQLKIKKRDILWKLCYAWNKCP